MPVDASAVARVLGIETLFKDLRSGSVLFLPQRIFVIAQGSSDSVFSSTKFQGLSAGQVGSVAGFGSPAHLAAKQLFPPNGDGVGSIPVTFALLADHGSGAAAVGGLVPSGSQITAGSYRVNVNNILSEAFVIPVGASVSTICKLIHDAIVAVLDMPVKATYTYGSITAGALVGTGNGTLTALTAPGGAKAGVWSLVLNTVVPNGGVWTLTDPDGVVVSTAVTMTPAPLGATVINAGGLQFTLTDGSTDFGIGASFTLTVPATNVVLTSKWKGVSANAIRVTVVGEALGTVFAITQPTGGLVNPSVSGALAQMGNVWETFVLNALDIADTTALDAIQAAGEGRWNLLFRKPFVAFTGNTSTTYAAATAVSSLRRTDRINAQLVSPGSSDLPFVVAARQLARIAPVANNNPPTDYGGQRATGLTPGADGVQWDYPTRDAAVKAGSSTVEIKDGVVTISDVVTFYRPTGEEPPAYRFVNDIVKVWQILFNVDLKFAGPQWTSAPLIPDDQVTVNPNARKPKHAKADLSAITDGLALQAIISDPKFTKTTLTAAISSMNPRRLDIGGTFKISGNTGIIDVPLAWGFFFGTPAAAA